MSAQARPARSRLIAAVHAAAARAGLDGDTRRALQRNVTGKDSCADMTVTELLAVLDRINGKTARPARGFSRRPAPNHDRAALVRKVYALLGDRPVKYAEGILRHMFGDDAPDVLEWAKPDQLWRLVCALEYDKKRRAARAEK
ncbi:MAG: regulatory protein GemA [Candidatus Hydrogenedens sp.]|nr:regulatory protein GemA [Candidatus Hydrogenedentota bacterium]NLF56546.1 regulatory protein GemA [Candidatus Hydrogenedens sp.]